MIFNDTPLNAVPINGRLNLIAKFLDDAIRLVSASAMRNWNVTANNLLRVIDDFIKTVVGGGTINTLTKSDVLLLTDQLIKAKLNGRFLADALVLTDSSVRTALRNKTLGETMTLADALSRTLVLNRYQLEQLALTDGFSKFMQRVRQLDDALVLTDQALPSRAKVLTAQDQLTLLDNALAYKLRGRTQQDNLTLADVLVSGLLRARRLDENVLLVDSFTKTVLTSNIVTRQLSDALALRDANFFHDWTVFFSDRALLTDEVIAVKLAANVKTKLLTDNLILRSDDGIQYNDFLYTEQIQLTDSQLILGRGQIFRLVDDALALVDFAAVIRDRTFVELMVLDDSQGRYRELAMIADDDLALVDDFVKTLTTSNVKTKNLVDTIFLTSATLRRNYTVIASQLSTMADTFSKVITGPGIVVKNLVDNLVLQSDSSWGRVFSVLATDEIQAVIDAFSKSVTSGGVATKNLVDNLTLLDQRIQSRFVFAVRNDTIPFLTDNAVTGKLAIRWMSDTLRLVDSFAIAAGALNVKVLSDSLLITDGNLKYQVYYRALIDNLALLDSLQTTGRKTVVLDDAIQVTDATQKYLLLSRQLQDFIVKVTDDKTLVKLLNRVDALSLADGQVTFVTKVRSFVEAVFLTDDVRRALNRTTISTDTLALSDEMLARFLPLLQYEVRMKLSVAAKEMALGVDVVTQLRVDPRAMELAVA